MKQELILIKVGEIALKGLNRRTFEDVLMKNIKRHLAPLGKFEVRSAQSTIYVRPLEEDVDLDDACERVGKVFGIAAYSRACMAKKDMDDINRTAAEYLKEALEEASTFKVEAKRSDKAFPLKSPAICAETGGYLLERFPNLSSRILPSPWRSGTLEPMSAEKPSAEPEESRWEPAARRRF